MKETVEEFWRARNSRERWVIVIASGLLLIALLDTLLWQPLLKSRDRLRRSVTELRLSAEQVKTQSALAQQLKARAGANTAQTSDLSQALSQAATAAGLSKNLSEVRSTDPGQCTAVVQYPNPVFSDNCAGANLVLTSGLPSGSAFPKGVTTLNWQATCSAFSDLVQREKDPSIDGGISRAIGSG